MYAFYLHKKCVVNKKERMKKTTAIRGKKRKESMVCVCIHHVHTLMLFFVYRTPLSFMSNAAPTFSLLSLSLLLSRRRVHICTFSSFLQRSDTRRANKKLDKCQSFCFRHNDCGMWLKEFQTSVRRSSHSMKDIIYFLPAGHISVFLIMHLFF